MTLGIVISTQQLLEILILGVGGYVHGHIIRFHIILLEVQTNF